MSARLLLCILLPAVFAANTTLMAAQVASFANAVNTMNATDIAAHWAEDGVFDDNGVHQGRDAIEKFWAAGLQPPITSLVFAQSLEAYNSAEMSGSLGGLVSVVLQIKSKGPRCWVRFQEGFWLEFDGNYQFQRVTAAYDADDQNRQMQACMAA
eukprot:TRINITY_DN17042_c0_g1_i1.p2 TRINITY_DN17042_c0_g1~~TRINITY_DN17042_c0_g1_i1.p2  ORF type:complete len:154 (-),score=37.95 TRINITY_DN17042_c0_g1_i1:44-505(-)